MQAFLLVENTKNTTPMISENRCIKDRQLPPAFDIRATVRQLVQQGRRKQCRQRGASIAGTERYRVLFP